MDKERYPNILTRVSENLSFLNGREVGIDIDAVTQATYILALRGASQKLGRVIQKEELVSYWHLAEIALQHGLSEAESMEFARGAWNRHDVYSSAPEMRGIRTLLDVFASVGVKPWFVSARPREFKSTTRGWFKRTFPEIVQTRKVLVDRKDSMSGGDFKALMAKKHDIGLFIEDAVEEALILADSGVFVLLVPQPWNIQKPINHPRIKHLGQYRDHDGSWPILRFLISNDAKEFFASVAQY